MEANFTRYRFIESLFTHVSVFRYHDNMQISWNFRENYQILVAVFKAPVEKPKQIFDIVLVQKEYFDTLHPENELDSTPQSRAFPLLEMSKTIV